ncbi:glycosyltransferase (activator-dependent family) [Kibdelosporangium banguiense]|uniref:Glycosyltransferase (Activator-dependent family) n=1 Tax=Kibdelosporangium banguiense TaxID=1365924 RepID=A0ABS4TXG4_9PSEU|nr:activator-dependent family glycosyltransferase [Kibdelosporangium banguiense]MBP2329076.1 glycosyltransferase (activator-dependent family) [Kibdelosporangium banguiense]
MRVLFVTNPERTVFKYMVPLAWALRTGGHEVRFAGQPCFTDEITQAGLTAVPVGRSLDLRRMVELGGDADMQRAGIIPPYDAVEDPAKATWDYVKPQMAEALVDWHQFDNFPLVAGLVEFARQWQPDLVIWDPLTFAGPIAAKACGAAHARLLFGIDVYGSFRQLYRRLNAEQPAAEQTDPLAGWLGGYGRKYGYEYTEDMATGHFTIDQFPRSLQVEAEDLDYVRMQYIPYGGPAVVPKWLQAPPQRPRVALTLGLSATQVYGGYNVPIADILESLSDLDIELVGTVTEAEQAKLGRIPDNARLVPYAPMHALVATCSAIIHHAGAATLATAARHPIPHLSLHYHYDQPILARLLREQGAGLEIHTTKVTGDNVRESLLRLLTEPQFGERATALRDEMFALPSPNELVGTLEELTTKYRTR